MKMRIFASFNIRLLRGLMKYYLYTPLISEDGVPYFPELLNRVAM